MYCFQFMVIRMRPINNSLAFSIQRRQRGRKLKALDLQFGSLGFTSHPDRKLDLLTVVPRGYSFMLRLRQTDLLFHIIVIECPYSCIPCIPSIPYIPCIPMYTQYTLYTLYTHVYPVYSVYYMKDISIWRKRNMKE